MPAGGKRKRSAPKGDTRSKKIKMEFSGEDHEQYYQGVSVLDLPGMGCGNCVLGTPGFTFQSPLDGLMRFEVMSGTKGLGTGGIRICVPSDGPKYAPYSPVFMVPLKHIEQFIIIDEPNQDDSTPTTEKSHRVLIVPTAAVGASALRKIYPKVISFTLPDRKVGSDFTEKFGKAAEDPEETCRGLVTRVFNEQLAPHKKSVIDVSSAAAAEDSDARLICDAVFRKGKKAVKPVAGKLFFLETGILFHSHETVLYLNAESTPSTMLVSNYEASSKRPAPVNLTFVCPTSEPHYEKAQESGRSTSKQHETAEPLFISFHDISLDMSASITQYAKRQGIMLDEVEQDWYSLKKNEPMTGWMPPGMIPRKR